VRWVIGHLHRKHWRQSRNYTISQKLRKLTFKLDQLMRARHLVTARLHIVLVVSREPGYNDDQYNNRDQDETNELAQGLIPVNEPVPA
jgi:hypothetical protein